MPGESSRDDFYAALQELEQSGGERDTRDTSLGTDDVFDAGTGEPVNDGAKPDAGAGDKQPREGRDASGRFAPKVPAQNEVPADQKQGAEAAKVGADGQPIQPAPQPGPARAPISWKPEEREFWDKLPPQAQAAVLRRDREVDAALRTSAEARQLQSEFQRVTAPYEAFFRAEGATAIQAVENLMQTAAALRTAPPGAKANLVAELITTYGIDLNTLDSVLSAKLNGTQAAPNPYDPVIQALEQRLKPIQDFMGSIQQTQQQSQQQVVQQATQTWQQFAEDPANEFAWDLKDDIADMLDLAARRGQVLSLQDAYKRATLLHPTISGIVQSRQQASGAAQQTAAARRALNAAVSLPSNGGAPAQDDGDEGDGSLRSDLTSSIRALSRSSR